MPSPVGHALAGYAAGTLIAGPPAVLSDRSRTAFRNRASLFAALGCLADVDFLFGTHSMYTHSVGAVLLIAALAAVATGAAARTTRAPGAPASTPARTTRAPGAPATRGSAVMAAACAAAYGSHPLLDWLGHDTNPPLGIMALWPFSAAYFTSPIPILTPVSRRFDWPLFWSHNLKVVTFEILIFGTVALVVHGWRGRPSRTGGLPS